MRRLTSALAGGMLLAGGVPLNWARDRHFDGAAPRDEGRDDRLAALFGHDLVEAGERRVGNAAALSEALDDVVFDRDEGVRPDSSMETLGKLRVLSPGGTVTASDEIYQRIRTFKSRRNVPVVTAMGGMATSGGYYAACAADYIYAQETTLTGNIGVLMLGFIGTIVGLIQLKPLTNGAGRVLERREAPLGILSVPDGRFAGAFERFCQAWLAGETSTAPNWLTARTRSVWSPNSDSKANGVSHELHWAPSSAHSNSESASVDSNWNWTPAPSVVAASR